MNTYLNLPAPAKLNLFLHVTGRKSDGMHLLESIFVLIDLRDQIDLEELPSGAIERVGDIEWDVEKEHPLEVEFSADEMAYLQAACEKISDEELPDDMWGTVEAIYNEISNA